MESVKIKILDKEKTHENYLELNFKILFDTDIRY